MARHEITLQAFVSSPSDVSEERAILEDIIRELNLTWSKSLGLRVELIKWETHVTPSVGLDPQHVINSQIGDDYDIFIGIMWSRFGTETRRFGSGTEEEFERAYARHLKDSMSVEIMFYFKDAGVQPSEIDIEQLSRVLSFKKKLGPKGALYGTYTSREEFAQHLRIHLSRVVQAWKANHISSDKTQLPSIVAEKHIRQSPIAGNDANDEVGFLDAIETSQERFEKLAQITTRMSEAVNDLGQKLIARTEQVKVATGNTDTSSGFDLKAAKRASDSLAEDMETFVTRMKVEIPLYSEASKTAIESWAHAANLLSDFGIDSGNQIEDALNALKFILNGLQEMQKLNGSFTKTIASLPRVTSAFNKARRHTVSVLEQLQGEVAASINLITEVEKLFLDIVAKNNPAK